jgi:hypothetical protein
MSTTGPETKNGSAGEKQQKFTCSAQDRSQSAVTTKVVKKWQLFAVVVIRRSCILVEML